jgi:hypothetical protein
MAKYITTVIKVFSPQNQNVPFFIVEEAVVLPCRHPSEIYTDRLRARLRAI